jgi:ribosomal protein S18 acetylase RimI-like enzyme
MRLRLHHPTLDHSAQPTAQHYASNVDSATHSLAGCPRLLRVKKTQRQCAVLGKVEGEGKLWHGHVTAVTVSSDCRRLGLATKLMNILEDTTEKVYVPMHLGCCCLGTIAIAYSRAVRWSTHLHIMRV